MEPHILVHDSHTPVVREVVRLRHNGSWTSQTAFSVAPLALGPLGVYSVSRQQMITVRVASLTDYMGVSARASSSDDSVDWIIN